ncbi:hypothetical protein WJX75_001671 [Coccomyxa subellipsoidea]|uniref:RNA polymerase Rpb4/RPC9 core domain-containing protein n=1 Tax=Coccomyxa subellipsoidea TaxID=248742 RepID=A0ABR2YBC2_9CHLO
MGDAPQEEEENAAEGRFPTVFDNAQALTNGEEYVERFSGNKNEAVNQQIRETLDAGAMTGFELASVANLQPESAEEAKILIPSLDVTETDMPRFTDDTLQMLLDDVATYKQA